MDYNSSQSGDNIGPLSPYVAVVRSTPSEVGDTSILVRGSVQNQGNPPRKPAEFMHFLKWDGQDQNLAKLPAPDPAKRSSFERCFAQRGISSFPVGKRIF